MNPIYEDIDSRFVRLKEPFSISVKGFGLVEVPIGFVCDLESVPRIPLIHAWLANTTKRGGIVHDYLCRRDSIPIVSKHVAADVYLEVMKSRKTSWLRRYVKYWVVRFVRGYFHKFEVFATYEQLLKGL